MGVLVLGAGGLLGSHICALYPEETVPIFRSQCDITDSNQIQTLLKEYVPTAVINCAGVVPRSHAYTNSLEVLRINAQAPHILADLCADIGTRLIQVSTDCVFDGLAGPYGESHLPHPDSLYGMSKLLGEVTDSPHLTIRTSFVGLPDLKGRGLLDWFRSTFTVLGYQKYMWNGLTTIELAHVLIEKIVWDRSLIGLEHICNAQPISKYDLLLLVQREYGWAKMMHPTNEPVINRVLYREWPNSLIIDKSYEQMVEEMHAKEETVLKWLRENQKN